MGKSKVMENKIINSLLNVLEKKDKYTAEHCRRVADYTASFAVFLGIEEKKVTILKNAALLHDIGKIEVDNNILQKTGILGEKEFSLIKNHPFIGFTIAENNNILSEEKEIILHHHERVDGNGYPHGLKGDEINDLCKVLSICDSYDAMTSQRSYECMSQDDALQELINSSGTQFDIKFVQRFIVFIRKRDYCPYRD